MMHLRDKSRRGQGYVLFAGLAMLAPALACAAMLSLAWFGVLDLNEPMSISTDCAHALATPWGNFVSVFNWPIVFLGFAYLAAATVAWLVSAGAVTIPVLLMLRAGAAVSAACVTLAIAADGLCIYWLILHAGNLAFWLFAELTGRRNRMLAAESNRNKTALQGIVTFVAAFALVSALLTVAVSEHEQRNEARLLAADAKASREMPATPGEAQFDAGRNETTSENQTLQKPVVASELKERRLHRLGSETAPLQIVVYLDYQCAESAEIDSKLQELYRRNGQKLSVCVRHYPRSTDCNYSQRVNLHPNACQAAKAVEAAGALRGTDGFWQMHQWVFERRGTFSRQDLEAALRKQKYEDMPAFIATMESPEILRSILADIVEAKSLGIKENPLVMLNGEPLAANGPAERQLAELQLRLEQLAGSQGVDTNWLPALVGEIADAETFSKQVQASAIAATVRIMNEDRNSVGSGVIVSARPPFVYVLTAHHVIAGAKTIEVELFSPLSYPRPSHRSLAGQVIATSPRIDAALLRLTTDQSGLTAIQIPPQSAALEQTPFLALSAGSTNDGAPTCRIERVAASKMVRRDAKQDACLVWEVLAESAKGRSGGPLLDSQGRLIGVGSGRSEGRGYYCHILEIKKFLSDGSANWVLDENRVPVNE